MSQGGAGRAEILVANPNRYPEIEVRRLRAWLAALLERLAPEADSLAVRFVGNRAIRELNRTYRSADRRTDVLSFPGQTTAEGRHLGDIAISVPVARRQAAELGHPTELELECLLLHGVLHCLGYDHETDDGAMERLESDLRRRWVGRDA